MVDLTTVLIAAISAGAGLAGSVIAGHFNLKTAVVGHRRDDITSMRAKVEELYAELDKIQNQGNVTSSKALVALNSSKAPEKEFESISLGKIRSIVGLYLPACQPAIDSYDQRAIDNGRTLRKDLEEKKLDPLTAGFGYVLLECQSLSLMCGQMRKLLGTQADTIGKSARDSLNTTK